MEIVIKENVVLCKCCNYVTSAVIGDRTTSRAIEVAKKRMGHILRLKVVRDELKKRGMLIMNKVDIIEKLVEKHLVGKERNPLEQRESRFLVSMMLQPDVLNELEIKHKNPEVRQKHKEFIDGIEENIIYKVLVSRLHDVGIECRITYPVALLLLMKISVIGDAVIYASYIAWASKKHRIKVLDIDAFCKQVFQWGYLRESDMKKFWDAQKVPVDERPKGIWSSDNYVDYRESWESLVWGKKMEVLDVE